ncbi:hypothetical protein PT2222_30285 [Paraburkholderia tropica]
MRSYARSGGAKTRATKTNWPASETRLVSAIRMTGQFDRQSSSAGPDRPIRFARPSSDDEGLHQASIRSGDADQP